MFTIVLTCFSCPLFLFSPVYFNRWFGVFLFLIYVVSFSYKSCTSGMPTGIYKWVIKPFLKALHGVELGWEGLEDTAWIPRLHFLLTCKQISLFTVDHQMMISRILSEVLFSFSNSWQWEIPANCWCFRNKWWKCWPPDLFFW